jgi:hypothetical protein
MQALSLPQLLRPTKSAGEATWRVDVEGFRRTHNSSTKKMLSLLLLYEKYMPIYIQRATCVIPESNDWLYYQN